jgi:hypothetical protein
VWLEMDCCGQSAIRTQVVATASLNRTILGNIPATSGLRLSSMVGLFLGLLVCGLVWRGGLAFVESKRGAVARVAW